MGVEGSHERGYGLDDQEEGPISEWEDGLTRRHGGLFFDCFYMFLVDVSRSSTLYVYLRVWFSVDGKGGKESWVIDQLEL